MLAVSITGRLLFVAIDLGPQACSRIEPELQAGVVLKVDVAPMPCLVCFALCVQGCSLRLTACICALKIQGGL